LVCFHARDGHALLAAALAADDSHGAAWRAQTLREEFDERVVGRTLDRRRRQTDQQRAVTGAGYLGFSGSGNDADGENDAVRSTDEERRTQNLGTSEPRNLGT
jgi:hypothetical protein